MSAGVLAAALVEAALGGSLIALGSWGAANAARLVPGTHGDADDQQLVRPYLRGALACRVVGVALVLLSILVVVDALV